MGRLSKQSTNAVLFILVRSVSLLIPLATLPLLGRVLSPAGLGMLAYAQAWMQFGSLVVDFGFNHTTISTVARADNNSAQLRTIFWSLTALRALLMVVFATATTLLAWLLIPPSEERHVVLLALLLLVGTLLTPTWLYQGLEHALAFSVLSLLPRIAIFPLVLTFVSQPDHVPRAAMILFGTECVSGLSLFFYAWFRLVPGRPLLSRRLAFAEARQAFDVLLGTLISGAFASVAPIVIRQLADLHAVGLYSAADRLVRVVFSFISPVIQAYQAEVTREWANRSPRLVKTLRDVSLLLTGSGLLFCVAMQWWAKDLLRLVFGGEFVAAERVLQIASLWPALATLTSLAVYFLYVARNRSKPMRQNYLLACGAYAVLLPLLATQWGADGAALALVLSQAMLSYLMLKGAKPLDLPH